MSTPSGAPLAGPCRLLSAQQVAAVLPAASPSEAALPAGVGGVSCRWAAGDRAVSVEVRADSDLDRSLRSAGVTARTVLDDSIATESDRLMPVPGLGAEAFAGVGHVFVALADGSTVVIEDEAGLRAAQEITLARDAVARSGG